MSQQGESYSRRSASRRRGRSSSRKVSPPPIVAGMTGGAFEPLDASQLQAIHESALDVLATVGMADPPACVTAALLPLGAKMNASGRLLYPSSLIESALAGFSRDIVLHGQLPGHELRLSKGRVHMGSGGAAPLVLDHLSDEYRSSTLQDLYDAARVVDALDNIHFFSRSVVARDMVTPASLDLNTAYASLSGTSKHVITSVANAENAQAVISLCHAIAGDAERFSDKPFLSFNVNHVVPPLRFIEEACEVMVVAVEAGVPCFINSFDQGGASSPASLAGSLVQAVAETLAGMVFCWALNPKCEVVFGPRPLLTDLRTGAMSSGSGEQAVLMAGAVQMANFYGLPNSCIAGGTDSKLPDAQSGYEKATTITLAAHAGCNVITQACGVQASLMGCALESYVIDNDMVGGIIRSVRGIETESVRETTGLIQEAVEGEGHFLGASDTYDRMQKDFYYPPLANRQSPEQWQASGSPDIRTVAKHQVSEILQHRFPSHINDSVDHEIREHFDIQLARSSMSAKECEQ